MLPQLCGKIVTPVKVSLKLLNRSLSLIRGRVRRDIQVSFCRLNEQENLKSKLCKFNKKRRQISRKGQWLECGFHFHYCRWWGSDSWKKIWYKLKRDLAWNGETKYLTLFPNMEIMSCHPVYSWSVIQSNKRRSNRTIEHPSQPDFK